MSFGKKGVAPGEASSAALSQARTRPATRATPARPVEPEDPYAAQRAAFIAAERASGNLHSATASAPLAPRKRKSGFILGDPAKRTLVLAYVYWYFCAPLGLHRIYCGNKESGLDQMALFIGGLVIMLIWAPLGLLALGAWLIWIIADLFLIPGMLRRCKAEHQADYVGVFA